MKVRHIFLMAAMPLVCFCTKNIEPASGQKEEEGVKPGDIVTITAAIPETRVSISAGTEATDPALVLSWEAADKIVVKGTAESEFSLTEMTDSHHATFEGAAVSGSTFDVYYPSAAILTRSYEGQVQNGDGSTAHLQFNAMAEGLTSYESVTFSKVNGAVKLVVLVPASVTAVSSLSITSLTSENAEQQVFYKTNDATGEKMSTISLGFAEGTAPTSGTLTAYAMVSWNDVELASGSKLLVKLAIPGKECTYQKTITLTQAVTVTGGKTAIVDLSDATALKHTLAGSGTESDPYKLYDIEDLLEMSSLLDTEKATYFKLLNDIDMAGVDWTPANQGTTASPYCQIFFDGGNHTISNLTFDKTGIYAGFIGVLWGKVSNVTFANPNITATKAAGVVCGYAGTTASGTALPAEIENVNIVNGNVTQNGNAHLGLVFGNTNAPGKFTNIHTTGTVTLSSSAPIATNKAAAGGICGSCADATFSKCSFIGTVNGGRTSGGLIGFVRETTSVITSVTESWAEADVALTKINSVNGEFGGGIAGYVKSATIANCYFKGSVTIATQVCGGIVGEAYGPEVKIENCWTSASLKAARVVGGIVGRACNGGWTTNGAKCLDISNCVYWGEKIDAAAATASQGSSGAIVGYTGLTNVLKNCWRNPQMEFVNTGNEVNKPVDQPDCDGTNWAKSADTTTGEATQIGTGASPQQYLFPYWGKASDAATVSATVTGKNLGWDTTIWNLSGDEPRLINNPEPVVN